ncbi:MAG: preprotein translocase subunit SecG [Deltaproteobacteria bacterium]|nr:preprotein translocase subunit SecG [Deltaproteobacteria bacterium]
MILLVTTVHILVCLGLIVVVLLQTGKGTDMGAAFGGGSSTTVFGSSGAGNFLTRLTTGMAVVFMLTSLTLGYFSEQGTSTSVFDSVTPQTQTSPQPGPAGSGAETPASP